MTAQGRGAQLEIDYRLKLGVKLFSVGGLLIIGMPGEHELPVAMCYPILALLSKEWVGFGLMNGTQGTDAMQPISIMQIISAN